MSDILSEEQVKEWVFNKTGSLGVWDDHKDLFMSIYEKSKKALIEKIRRTIQHHYIIRHSKVEVSEADWDKLWEALND